MGSFSLNSVGFTPPPSPPSLDLSNLKNGRVGGPNEAAPGRDLAKPAQPALANDGLAVAQEASAKAQSKPSLADVLARAQAKPSGNVDLASELGRLQGPLNAVRSDASGNTARARIGMSDD